MNLAEGIAKLKVLLSMDKKEDEVVTTEQSFKDEKLDDGLTIISYDADELATGVVVNILDEAGQKLPLPVGDYTTETGTTFSVVDETGAIDNVVLAEAPAEEGATPTTEAPMGEDKPAMPSKTPTTPPKRVIKSQVEEHVFNAFKKEVEEVNLTFAKQEDVKLEFEKLTNIITKQEATIKAMFEIISQIADEPIKKGTEEVKDGFSVSEFKKSYKADLAKLDEQN